MRRNRRQKGTKVGWHRQPFDYPRQISAQFDDVLVIPFANLPLTVIFRDVDEPFVRHDTAGVLSQPV